MLAKVCSAALAGIDAYPVEVEVNAGYGDTIIVIVGLPDAAVKESRDRVTTALVNSGYECDSTPFFRWMFDTSDEIARLLRLRRRMNYQFAVVPQTVQPALDIRG